MNSVLNDDTILLMIVFIGILLFLIVFVKFVIWLNDFQEELKFIIAEINRTDGEEQEYWIYKKKRLWLSILPFYKY